MKICVYGAASPKIEKKYIEEVEKLGLMMAGRGHELVFGAGENGLMGAAARGVKRGGGRIHGIIPAFFRDENVEAIYPLCDELTFTKDMRERKQLLEDSSDAFIIVPGGIGTFEEFFEVLTLKQLGRHSKPIVIFNIDGYYDDLIAVLTGAEEKGFINENCLKLYGCTADAAEALRLVEEHRDESLNVRDLKDG